MSWFLTHWGQFLPDLARPVICKTFWHGCITPFHPIKTRSIGICAALPLKCAQSLNLKSCSNAWTVIPIPKYSAAHVLPAAQGTGTWPAFSNSLAHLLRLSRCLPDLLWQLLIHGSIMCTWLFRRANLYHHPYAIPRNSVMHSCALHSMGENKHLCSGLGLVFQFFCTAIRSPLISL